MSVTTFSTTPSRLGYLRDSLPLAGGVIHSVGRGNAGVDAFDVRVRAGSQTVWDTAQSVADFIQADHEDVDFVYPRLLAPGAITETFSPRGVGKSQLMTAVLKDVTDRGKRVLLLDRDNPRREVRRR